VNSDGEGAGAGVGFAKGLFCGNNDFTSDVVLMAPNGFAGFGSVDDVAVNVVDIVAAGVAFFAKRFEALLCGGFDAPKEDDAPNENTGAFTELNKPPDEVVGGAVPEFPLSPFCQLDKFNRGRYGLLGNRRVRICKSAPSWYGNSIHHQHWHSLKNKAYFLVAIISSLAI